MTPRYNNDPVTQYSVTGGASDQSLGSTSGQSTLTRRKKTPLVFVDPVTKVSTSSLHMTFVFQEEVKIAPVAPRSEAADSEARPTTADSTVQVEQPSRSHTTSICSEVRHLQYSTSIIKIQVAPEERAPAPAVVHKPLLLQDPKTGQAVKLPDHPIPSNPHPPQQPPVVRAPYSAPSYPAQYTAAPPPHFVGAPIVANMSPVVPNGVHEVW